jgi:hypothetical protein
MENTINKTVYKQLPQEQTLNRTMKPLTNTQKVNVHTIVSKFITLLKAAHA